MDTLFTEIQHEEVNDDTLQDVINFINPEMYDDMLLFIEGDRYKLVAYFFVRGYLEAVYNYKK